MHDVIDKDVKINGEGRQSRKHEPALEYRRQSAWLNAFLCFEVFFFSSRRVSSDVPAPAWPESPGFGLALGGLGLRKS